jgi:hypothetical protein
MGDGVRGWRIGKRKKIQTGGEKQGRRQSDEVKKEHC